MMSNHKKRDPGGWEATLNIPAPTNLLAEWVTAWVTTQLSLVNQQNYDKL